MLDTVKLSFKNEGEMKTFPGKKKKKKELRDFMTTRSASHEMLKEVLKVEMKRYKLVT